MSGREGWRCKERDGIGCEEEVVWEVKEDGVEEKGGRRSKWV